MLMVSVFKPGAKLFYETLHTYISVKVTNEATDRLNVRQVEMLEKLKLHPNMSIQLKTNVC